MDNKLVIKAQRDSLMRIEQLKGYCRTRFWAGMVAHYLEISMMAASNQLARYEKRGIVRFTGDRFENQKIYVWAEQPVEAKQVRKRELKLKVDESNCRKLEFLARIRLFSVEDYVDDLIRREVQQHDWDKLND